MINLPDFLGTTEQVATQENGDTVRAKRATRNNYIETTEEIDHFVENGI